ncbi:alpha/beta hydrolase [Paraburkholderia acidicola]|uniref:Alpha/beta hydrolase n=1 Tax=Paraburkholderia acidicola TaxID=1912599 RepID=A0ABV1LUL1_9BURK
MNSIWEPSMDTEHKSLLDHVARLVLRVVGILPTWLQRWLGGKPVRIDGQVLHPEVQLALRLLNLVPGSSFETLPLAEARAVLVKEAQLFGNPVPIETVRDISIPGEGGPIPARLYRPANLTGPSALLVYFHGGGWVLGDLRVADSACRVLAIEAKLSVLSIDYRLAPEHPFPAGLNDALTAFKYAVDNAAALGIDPAAIGIGGESAGGNLTAVVSQITTAGNGPKPAFQLMFFPVTDLSTKHASYALFADGFFLTATQMDWYRNHYLTNEAEALDPRVSPLLAKDLAGLPPAYVAVAGFDPLRDEGLAYARRLSEAGVPVTLRLHDGLIHGIINALGVGHTGRDALIEAAGVLRAGLTSLADVLATGPGGSR